ncbi:hypothetical protein JS530_08340 [Bifidobacterium sp. LC6]|uniref:Sugar ABC transporter substrate-binding protein n=1 Tax=Bifidobacterium colobi TaxID=2809026 RepID=A0ABS5UY20_9BIFI|nr:hypothetical protein [Bifidobacterium colobi]MBT1175501.1 hypothetical protein [Bifidobacterium colobi]
MNQRIIGAIALCLTALLSLTACTPVGHAVGDTQDKPSSISHDSIHISDMSIGLVGSEDSAADKLAIDALADAGISVHYASLGTTETTSESSPNTDQNSDGAAQSADQSADQSNNQSTQQSAKQRAEDTTAQHAVEDFLTRPVSLLLISGINVTDANRESWNQTLTDAREAGIPVALLNPRGLPDDDLLYAATLTVNDRDANATRIADAAMTIIRDEPHERTIAVSTVSSR